MKRIIPLLLIALAAVAAYYLYTKSLEKKDPSKIELSGTIETTQVDLSFQIPGRIVRLIPQEGDHVKKGELLGVLDDKDLRQQIRQSQSSLGAIRAQLPQLATKIETSRVQEERQLAQARAQVDEARFRWESLRKGSREQEIARARFAMSQAKHSLDQAKREYERAQNLFKEGAMAGQQRDNAESAFLVTKEQYRQSIEFYDLTKKGPRQEDIDAAGEKVTQAQAGFELIMTQALQTKQLEQQRGIMKAQMDQANEAITQARIQAGHTKIYSPINGVILLRPREPGEVVAASTPVLTMANIEKVWLKAYVGEQDLGKVKLGQKVVITTDSFPQKKYEGKIYYISSEAEFTPKNLQTREDRVKLVYRIKVEVPNPDQELKPGMIADGLIDLGGH
jgi:HlyD family secretion protein